MENKYNEEFEAVNCFPRGIDQQYDEVICENSKGALVHVYIENGEIDDDYYGELVKPEYREILDGIIKEYIPEYKNFFYFSASSFDSEYGLDTPLESVLYDDYQQFFTRNYMFISESTASELTEEDYKSLVKAIGEKGLRIRIYMYSISDENYESIDINEDIDVYIKLGYRRNELLSVMTEVK